MKNTISQFEAKGIDKGRNYLLWNDEMDSVLENVLIDQMNMGYKADAGWKLVTYIAIVNALNARFNLSLNKDKIKNRLKSWGKHYVIVSEIIKQSGFTWDSTKKMITMDDPNMWDAYVKVYTI